MNSTNHLARLSGWAVALGLGAAVATGHGVAAADSSDSATSDASSAESSESSSDAPDTSDTSSDESAESSTPDAGAPESLRRQPNSADSDAESDDPDTADAGTARSFAQNSDASHVSKSSTSPTVDDDLPEVSDFATSNSSSARTASAPEAITEPLAHPVTPIRALPPASTAPVRPATPAPFAELAFAVFRRLQTRFFNQTPTAEPIQTGQSVAGVITGDVNAADADGDPLRYSVTRQGLHGSVVVNNDGTYSYTPDEDFATSGATDTFTITISEANAASHLHGPADLFNNLLRIVSIGLFNPPDASAIERQITVHASVVSTTIPVGKFPHDPSVTPGAGSHVYIANDNGAVSVLDTAANAVVKTITVNQGFVGDVAVSPSGSYAYVTGGLGSNTLSILNVATNAITGTTQFGSTPTEIGFSPDGAYAYIFNEGPTSVSVVDTASRTVVATIDIAASSGPTDLAVRPDGRRVYVANNFERTLSVIDTDPLHIGYRTVIKTIPLDRPNGVAVSPDSRRVYVSHEFSGQQLGNTVSVIDTATNSVIDTIVVGVKPGAMAVSPDGTRLYVANNGDDTLSVVDTATDAVVATLAVGGSPSGVVVSPDGSRIYVTNQADHTVSVIAR